MDLANIQKQMSLYLQQDDAISTQFLKKIIFSKRLKAEDALKIYKENYLENLSLALERNYPLTVLLLGKECFQSLARSYAQKYPSSDSDLSSYGVSLDIFVSEIESLKQLAYLKSFVSLEQLYQSFYSIGAFDIEYQFQEINKYILSLTQEERGKFSKNIALFSSNYNLLKIWKLCVDEYEGKKNHAELKIKEEKQFIILYWQNDELYLESLKEDIWQKLQSV